MSERDLSKKKERNICEKTNKKKKHVKIKRRRPQVSFGLKGEDALFFLELQLAVPEKITERGERLIKIKRRRNK